MELEEALTTYLLAQSAITALIDRRFFYDEAPATTKRPYITVENISDVKDHELTGQSELEAPTFQFTIYAETKPAEKAVAKQVKAAMSDYQGTLSGLVVDYIKLINELHGTYTSPDGTIKSNTGYLEYEVNFERGD